MTSATIRPQTTARAVNSRAPGGFTPMRSAAGDGEVCRVGAALMVVGRYLDAAAAVHRGWTAGQPTAASEIVQALTCRPRIMKPTRRFVRTEQA